MPEVTQVSQKESAPNPDRKEKIRNFIDRFLNFNLKELFFRERMIDKKSGLTIVEEKDGKQVLSNGEIIKDGELWGYRVYKGVSAWDLKQGRPSSPILDKSSYEQELQEALSDENFGLNRVPWGVTTIIKENHLSNQEKLALVQMYGAVTGGSWSRDPSVAIDYSNGMAKADVLPVVVSKDVPKEDAVSIEALIARYPELVKFIEKSYILEREVTVFHFVDIDFVDKLYSAEDAIIQLKRKKLDKKNLKLFYSLEKNFA
jgi:hypothetical protein